MADQEKQFKVAVGYVEKVSGKDTAKVVIETRKPHPHYKKIVRVTKKFLVHDNGGKAGVGDKVQIQECRPISRMKRWRLVRVLEKAKVAEGVI